MKFDIWVFLKKFVKKIEVWLKSDKKKEYFTWRHVEIYDILLTSS